MAIHFDHTHKDPEMRGFLTNRDMRIALSRGINRAEIIGIPTRPGVCGVVNAKLRNVPDALPGSWMYPDPGPTLPQTYFDAE